MDPRTPALAEQLADLHRSTRPLVLPTVWDAWSARLAVDAGFVALTVGSHPVADALGLADNEGMTPEDVFAVVRRITAAVDVPVSVDLESGYGADPAELVGGLLEAGGVGVNLEDTVHGEDGRLRSAEEHASLIGLVRYAANDAGVALVINGRTDLFLRDGGDHAPLLDEGIGRLRQLVNAGADVVYPVGVQDDATITALVEGIDRPVNITARPESGDLQRLTRLGVGRISYGPFLQMALAEHAKGLLADWR